MLLLSNEIFHCNKCFIAITYKNLCRNLIYAPIYRQLSQTRLTRFSPGKFLYQKLKNCCLESFCLFRPCNASINNHCKVALLIISTGFKHLKNSSFVVKFSRASPFSSCVDSWWMNCLIFLVKLDISFCQNPT